MKVLVTGGAGFIGSHIVEELLQRGHAVRVLDDFSTGRRANLQAFHGDLEILEGDLRDPSRVNAAVQGVEWIFHHAAFISVPESLRDPQTCFAINVAGTVTLLEAARKAGVKKVVLASSSAVYGDTQEIPTPEDTALRPLSPYAVSKHVNEHYARFYTHTFNLPVASLRYYNVYGPRQQPDSPYAAAIPIFLNRLLSSQPITVFGDGKQTRDFIFVKDIVRANLLAAESPDSAGEVFNICSGRQLRLLELLEELDELAPQQFEVRFTAPRPGDILHSTGKPDRARKVLGFQAETSLSEGLAQTWAWMKGK
jgi:nucleoside-diphosphate-sugar epimerase